MCTWCVVSQYVVQDLQNGSVVKAHYCGVCLQTSNNETIS